MMAGSANAAPVPAAVSPAQGRGAAADPPEIWIDRQACLDVAARFYHHLDRNEYDAVAALMADAGTWMRQGKPVTGRAAVLAALQGRPVDFVTRHLLANVVVDLAGRNDAVVGYDLSVYAREGQAPPRLIGVLTGEDRLTRERGQWRIRAKQAAPLFSFA